MPEPERAEKEAVPRDAALPRFSVVIPSFNQASFLPAALDSLLAQNYPALEIIVIDGGSTDATRAVIESYRHAISYWVSEPDRGQAHALNKGFSRATGAICTWLCADDSLVRDALHTIALRFGNPATQLVVGDAEHIDPQGNRIGPHVHRASHFRDLLRYHRGIFLAQPAVFYRAELLRRAGPLDENATHTMDLALWLQFGRLLGPDQEIEHLPQLVARMTAHAEQKTARNTQLVALEVAQLIRTAARDYGLSTRERAELDAELTRHIGLAIAAAVGGPSLPALLRALPRWTRHCPRFLATRPFAGFLRRSLFATRNAA